MQQNKISIAFVFILLLASNIAVHAQLFTPLGLGVEKCEAIGSNTRQQMHVEGDTLYVCTKYGLYSKDLSHEDNSWELAGFEDIPILDYIRSGEDMLALIKKTDGKYLLLSHDGGKTYEDVTPEQFRNEQYLRRLVQHPTDPNTLLVLGSMGIFQSSDFGQTWKKLIHLVGGYLGYHPLNPEIMYGSGMNDFMLPYIYISYDGGQTWDRIEPYMGSNCVGQIAFHPTDPNIWMAGGQMGRVFTSTDNGHTWDAPLLSVNENELFEAIWEYTVYDNRNSEIIYMAGRGYGNEVMSSTDGGKTWNNPQTVPQNKKNEYLYDFRQYGDKLLIYTESDVYSISKAGLQAQTVSVKKNTGLMTEEYHYGIDGCEIAPDVPGFHIIRSADGRVSKVLVK